MRDIQVIVAYCDIDDFKRVNDRDGHEAGDEELREVARALSAAVRPEDTVARLGGDEFAVVVAGTGEVHSASFVGERLLAAAKTASPPARVATLSIGVVGPGPASSATELLDEADRAMYEAKRSGKNRFVARELRRCVRDGDVKR
ncbi:MAG: GGDEF domain-containing protein [Acidimicrobiia bacterium]